MGSFPETTINPEILCLFLLLGDVVTIAFACALTDRKCPANFLVPITSGPHDSRWGTF